MPVIFSHSKFINDTVQTVSLWPAGGPQAD